MASCDDQILLLLGEIKGKVDAMSAHLSEHIAREEPRFVALEENVQGVKTSIAWATGGAAVVASVLTFVGTNLSALLDGMR